MWTDLRRRFTRRPTEPVPPPLPPPRGGIGVLDGTAAGLGGPLRAALAATGLPAVAAGPFDLQLGYRCLVVALPLTSGALPRAERGSLPGPGDDAVAGLGALAGDPRTRAAFRTALVVVWHVTLAARPRLAAPRAHRDGDLTGAWNAADLLVGRSWARDLRRHGGDEAATLRCRSARIARAAALTGAALGDTPVDRFCRTAAALDPRAVHTVVPDLAAPGGAPLRAGAAAVAAAVRLALTVNRSVPFGATPD